MIFDFVRIFLTPLLMGLSAIYGGLLYIRRMLWKFGFFSPKMLEESVISIGNIEAGGTGKSPVVMSLCGFLRKKGLYPAILTRGYGVPLKRGDHMILLAGSILSTSRPELSMPDEARMQSLRLPHVPVVVGPDRYASYQKFKDLQRSGVLHRDLPEISHWILDDGFQHWSLVRQWDIVLLGSLLPEARRLLPWGRLREPLSALNRARAILLMGSHSIEQRNGWKNIRKNIPISDEIPAFEVRVKGVPIERSIDWPHYGLPFPTGETSSTIFDPNVHLPAFLVSGIAKPGRFLSEFREIYESSHKGVQSSVAGHIAVGDHQEFVLDHLLKELQKKDFLSVVTTEKDLARDPSVFYKIEKKTNRKIFVLGLAVLDEELLWNKLNLI